MSEAWKARVLSLGAYGVALAGAALALSMAPEAWPLWAQVGLADGVATVIIFVIAVVYNNSSFYDPYWSVAPLVIANYLAWGPGWGEGVMLRQVLVVGLVTLYGIRLTYNFYRGWPNLEHEDWRYVDIRAKTGKAYWLVSFLGIMLMPSILTFVGCAGVYVATVTGDAPLGILDAVAALVTGGAIWIEATADKQLYDWVRSERQPGEIMQKGLWKYSRHPNYFGEITFWWGLFLFGMAADPNAWWTIAGPGLITALFVGISVPLIDKRSLARRPGYEEHIKRVSMIIPMPPRKPSS